MKLSAERFSGFGERPFMICGGSVFTYADLAREMERLQGALRDERGEPGQIVALTGRYNFLAASSFLALSANRAVVVPLVGGDSHEVEQRLHEIQVDSVVEVQDCRFTIRHPSLDSRRPPHSLIQNLRQSGRAGLILFSSGSTGRAKAMIHDLDTLIASYPEGKVKELRVLAFMGLDHIGGIDIFMRAIASGSCLVVPTERSPDAICGLIEEHRVNVLPTTPSFLNLMLLSDAFRGPDLSSLKIIGFGAERMPPAVLRRLRQIFPDVQFQQKFGTSETNAVRTVSKPSDPGWIRITDPEVEWKIVQGELWLKTPSRILGYINHESDRLLADGWYRTGDLVEEDGEGFFRIVGRMESVINVGGEKVLPDEVEAVIRELAEVRDCRVFAEANPILGQTVNAEVVAQEGVNPKELTRAIRRHCRLHLAPYKVPVKIGIALQIELSGRFKRKP